MRSTQRDGRTLVTHTVSTHSLPTYRLLDILLIIVLVIILSVWPHAFLISSAKFALFFKQSCWKSDSNCDAFFFFLKNTNRSQQLIDRSIYVLMCSSMLLWSRMFDSELLIANITRRRVEKDDLFLCVENIFESLRRMLYDAWGTSWPLGNGQR